VTLEPLDVVRSLVWTGAPSGFFKYSGLLLLAVGLGGFVWFSSTNPHGLMRRLAVDYVLRLDTDFKACFQPARGSQVAWLQVCGAIALVATYGFVPQKAFFFAAFLVLILPPIIIRRNLTQRRKELDDQAHGFALALANALKTTASIGDALWVALTVSPPPMRQELEMMLKQVRVGSTMEEALLAMSLRAQSPALDVLVSALLIGRQTGGDLPRILEGTSASLREIKRLEEFTEKVVGTARVSYLVSAALVIAIAITLPQIMPGFLDPLRDTVKGQMTAAFCVLAFLASAVLAYRITRVDI